MRGNQPDLQFESFVLSAREHRLTRNDSIVPLTPKAFETLAYLVTRAGEVVEKQDLMKEVWRDVFVEESTLTQNIFTIRKALGEGSYIETVPRLGYRFTARVTPLTKAPAGPAPNHRLRYWSAAAILLAVLVMGGWWMAASHAPSSARPLEVVSVSKLTSYPGDEREPSVSPQGGYVAFSWSGARGDNYDIYVVQREGQKPLRLTQDPLPDGFPAWSPDGRLIAFVRRNRAEARIIAVPTLGGAERVLYKATLGSTLDLSQHPVLSWSQDGKWIVFTGQSAEEGPYRLFQLSAQTGEVRALGAPPEGHGDSSPSLSSDGRFLAFVRYLGPLNGLVMVQPLGEGMVPSGEPWAVSKPAGAVHSPLWLENGARLLFADRSRIFEWRRNQEARQIYVTDGTITGLSLGPDGNGTSTSLVVAKTDNDSDLWTIPLEPGGVSAAGPARTLVRSTAREILPSLSPDGAHLAFTSNQSGTQEIWVANADGTDARQLTHLGAYVASYASWSPDGARVIFHARVPDVPQVYAADVHDGSTRRISDARQGFAIPSFSRDGRWIYAVGLRDGTVTIFRMPAEGGPAQRLWVGDRPQESADGKRLYYSKRDTPGIFSRSLEGDVLKNREQLEVRDYWARKQTGGFTPVSNGIYYTSITSGGDPSGFRFFEFARHKSADVTPRVPKLSEGFSVSPDRRHLVFSVLGESGGDLLSLEMR